MFQISIFILFISTGLSAWVFFVSRFFLQTFPILQTIQPWIYLISLLGSISFIGGLLGGNFIPGGFFSYLYKIGAVFVGSWWILFLLLLIAMGVKYFLPHIFLSNWILIIFLSIFFLLNIYSLYRSFYPSIIHYNVPTSKETPWIGKKIVMVSDTHYGQIYEKKDAQKLVQEINDLQPDLVLIPGDFFDGPKIDFESIAQEFTLIKATNGVYFASGNHEEYRNTKEMLESLQKAGIHMVNDSKEELDGLVIAGTTFHDNNSRDGLIKTLNSFQLDPNKLTILLKHKPDLQEVIEGYPVDLVVSGHTHYGQMWPFSWITKIIFKDFAYGSSKLSGTTYITTSGVGTWGPPQRLGTQSEIVEIRFVKQ